MDSGFYQGGNMGRIFKSMEDCSDCLCRVCANNQDNDSINSATDGIARCSCGVCEVFSEIVETEADCPNFIPDEMQ